MKTYIQNLFTRRGGASCATWVMLALLAGGHQAAAQPVVSFTQPTNGQQIVTFAGLAGTAQTATGTVQQVTFSIYNQSTGQWWDGTNFQGSQVSLPAILSGTNWVPASGVALPAPCCGQYYQLAASATDTDNQYRHDQHHRSGGRRSAGGHFCPPDQRTNRVQLVSHRRERHR